MNPAVHLPDLTRRPAQVALAALLGVLAGLLLLYRVSFPPHVQSRRFALYTASTSALVDTPRSQLVDLRRPQSGASEALRPRAAVLAALLTTAPLTGQVARRAGVAPGGLIVTAPDAGPGDVTGRPPPPATSRATVGRDGPDAAFLTLRVDAALPVIGVTAQARDGGVATRLAHAAVATLRARMAAIADRDGVPQERRVAVDQLGPARAHVATHGPRRLVAIVVGGLVFVLGCITILASDAVTRRWRDDPGDLSASGPRRGRAPEDDDSGKRERQRLVIGG